MSVSRAAFTKLGLTYRQLDYWTRKGYLNTHTRPASLGSGDPRFWPNEEVPVAKAMLQLVRAGFTVEAAARLARSRQNPTPLGEGLLLQWDFPIYHQEL